MAKYSNVCIDGSHSTPPVPNHKKATGEFDMSNVDIFGYLKLMLEMKHIFCQALQFAGI